MAKSDYSAIGMQALLPGIKYVLARLQEEVNSFELVLGSDNGATPAPKRRGRPSVGWPVLQQHNRSQEYWDRLPPAEAETQKRKRALKRAATMRKKYGKDWAKNMGAKIQAGRKKKQSAREEVVA